MSERKEPKDKPRDSGFGDTRQSLESNSGAAQAGASAASGSKNPLDLLAEKFRKRQSTPSVSDTDSDSESSSIGVLFQDVDSEPEESEIIMTHTASIDLDKYSGLPRGSRFPTSQGERTEQYEVGDWCRRVETIAASVSWTDTVTASHAALALVPGSPAENWLRLQQKEKKVQEWPQFKALIIARFSPPVTAMQRVAMIRSMKQDKNERVEDFKNRLQIQFESLEDGVKANVDKTWGVIPDGDAKIEVIRKTTTSAMEYVLQCLFLAGLQERFVTDITKSEAKTLDEMVDVAKKTEVAAGPGNGRIAAITADEERPEETDKPITRGEIERMIAAISRSTDSKQKDKEAKTSKKQRPQERQRATDIVCYYCFTKGHTTKACKAITADRRAGIHRATVRDQPMTKAEFNNLTYEERTKGKHMVAEVLAEEQSRISTIRARTAPQEASRTRTVEEMWSAYSAGN